MTAVSAVAQTAPTDTIVAPPVVYSSVPRTYTIAGITVSGAPNYRDDVVQSYAGLKVGERIEIPGAEISNAAKRLFNQGLFSQVQIKIDKVADGKVWLEYAVRQQPRIHEVRYQGVKKNEREDLQERLHLMPGNQLTPEVVSRVKAITTKYFDDKGFKNADVRVRQEESLSAPGEMVVTIDVDKHNKIKVHKIYITGNDVLSDSKIKRVMKKTNEKTDLLKIFSQKKFVDSDYQDDLNRILEKYNELGYRDAVILSDSVVPYDDGNVDVYINLSEGDKYYISGINWVGNTVYPTELLDALLELKPGDVYNQKQLDKRLKLDEDAVSNLYSNNGYLFARITPYERSVSGDSVALDIRVIEGPQAYINAINISGNDRVYEKVVRRELREKPGDLFSRERLMRSYRELAQMGHFNPETINPDVQPNQENGTVDINWELESKSNDQVEFSLGWGQTGIIGKIGLKFSNFSIKNLLYPSTYKGIIPQGEGQTFSISAQTNARYYQAYSVSFLDPWFGGKRPNQFSVTGFYSRQTGINSSFYNKNYYNALNSYGYGYGYGYGYNSDYYQSTYEDAYDPNKVLQMAGVTVGFGKRLNWPDDYFTFNADLTYNWYSLKNWDYLYYMNNGVSNSLVLGLTLGRNDIDNPIYTRQGSSFSINLQLTPPASLFMPGRNWKKLSETTSDASVNERNAKERYKWIEYFNVRLNSVIYT
ncbi:MAG: outer membrane protein assembly factor BamA, partial [Muribaculaceae bacterium]|nr:outer membrane protein assembly factor BamA [Muribaculaceae bacterium]